MNDSSDEASGRKLSTIQEALANTLLGQAEWHDRMAAEFGGQRHEDSAVALRRWADDVRQLDSRDVRLAVIAGGEWAQGDDHLALGEAALASLAVAAPGWSTEQLLDVIAGAVEDDAHIELDAELDQITGYYEAED